MKCSVIICTHNPREDYLRRTLTALKEQTLPQGEWELLLIDNASEKPLADIWDLSWHQNARHIRELKIGLTHARHCGISESKGELLVFVDDDNLLRPNYLVTAIDIGNRHPWLGAWGGSCLPEFEVEPPPEIQPWTGCLTLYQVKISTWAKLPVYSEACPAGAGVILRRSVAEYYQATASKNPLRQALGRSGKSLGAGEDIDMALSGFALGLGVGRFPELELTHLIPARRLTVEHVVGILDGFGYADIILGLIHQPGYQPPIRRRRRLWLISLMLLFKSRATKRIKLAPERGRLRAYRELKKLGYFNLV